MTATPAVLEARARIRRAVRDWFDQQGFVEVETPARVRSPGQEVHLDAVPAGAGHWLITSPEYHLKKLVAAGLPRVYELGRCWRAHESGPHHAVEFTMLEWYRAGAPLEALADDCESLVRLAFRAAGREPTINRENPGRVPAPSRDGLRRAEPSSVHAPWLDAPFTRTTVRELFADFAGIELAGDEDVATLRAKAQAAGVSPGSANAWDDVFFQVFLDRVEPALAAEGATFVFDWPAPLGALARPHPRDPRLVERFELYANGLELANAFGELTDPAEQRRRFLEEARIRAERGRDVYPIDEGLLAALPRMPPTAGIALGFDRLVMLALGASRIDEVLAFSTA
jgi:elongation factor P--(R)-beta-lysine ligase